LREKGKRRPPLWGPAGRDARGTQIIWKWGGGKQKFGEEAANGPRRIVSQKNVFPAEN